MKNITVQLYYVLVRKKLTYFQCTIAFTTMMVGCLKNVFRQDRSLLRRVNTLSVPPPYRIFLEEFHHRDRRHIGPQFSAI